MLPLVGSCLKDSLWTAIRWSLYTRRFPEQVPKIFWFTNYVLKFLLNVNKRGKFLAIYSDELRSCKNVTSRLVLRTKIEVNQQTRAVWSGPSLSRTELLDSVDYNDVQQRLRSDCVDAQTKLEYSFRTCPEGPLSHDRTPMINDVTCARFKNFRI